MPTKRTSASRHSPKERAQRTGQKQSPASRQPQRAPCRPQPPTPHQLKPAPAAEPPEQPLEAAPLLANRHGLAARIHRNVFYHLVELAEERETDAGTELVLTSDGCEFSLGTV